MRRVLIAAVLLLVGCQTVGVDSTPSATTAPSLVASATVAESATEESSPAEAAEAVKVGLGELNGEFLGPDDATHAVLLLPGSGPQDKDGSLMSGPKPIRDFAQGLANEGIASLRFDKRTYGAPTLVDLSTFTVEDEYLADADAALTLLAERYPGARLFVVGHSQGAMILPELLSRHPEVAGGVSLSGTPRSLWDVILDQGLEDLRQRGVAGEELKTQEAQLRRTRDEVAAIDSPDDTVPPAYSSSMGAAYVASLNALDPVGVARGLEMPLLFMHGSADRQVSAETDFGAWKAALEGKTGVDFVLLDGLGHFYWPAQGETMMDDLMANMPVSTEAVTTLADWINAH